MSAKMKELTYKLRSITGLSLMYAGLLMIISTYVAFATGFIHMELLRWPGIWLELLTWPAFSIGFMLNAKWKKDMRFTKHKAILLLAFLLFYPAPMVNFFGVGRVPPIYTLLIGMEYSISCSPREIVMFFLITLITLLEFAILLCFGHIFSCFVHKYTKNKYISWILLVVMATVAFSGKYFWGDVGGGHHDVNIVESFFRP